MTQNMYEVAGIKFTVNLSDGLSEASAVLLDNYAPFAVSDSLCASEIVFDVNVERQEGRVEFTEDMRQVEEGQSILCGRNSAGENVFEFLLGGKLTGTLICSDDFRNARALLCDFASKFALNNSLMVMYALASAKKNVALFHSAVVTYKNRGYMFLGKSGTGKSTHARLWLAHIEGTELLNDDNPVVCLRQDGAWVYGSPWSGKTPCYINKGVRLGAIVDLSQAPYNKIRSIEGIEAYVALLPSISGMRWNKSVADGLHQTENELAKNVGMYHLDCLPDEAAAKICCEAVAAKFESANKCAENKRIESLSANKCADSNNCAGA